MRHLASASAIFSMYQIRSCFSFKAITKDDIQQEINLLNASKVIQDVDLPIKNLKEKQGIFCRLYSKTFH